MKCFRGEDPGCPEPQDRPAQGTLMKSPVVKTSLDLPMIRIPKMEGMHSTNDYHQLVAQGQPGLQPAGGVKQIVNDFSIQIATVNGSGSQSANSVLLRSIFRMGVPVSGKNLISIEYCGTSDLVHHSRE